MNSNELALKVLRASRIFGALDTVVLDELAKHLTFHSVRGGDTVFNEGDPADSMMFVASGGLRVSRRDQNGRVSLFNQVRPGQGFGEIGLILQQPRAQDVTALRDSTLAVLSRASFETLLALHPLALNRAFVQNTYNFLRPSMDSGDRHFAQSLAIVALHEDADTSSVATGLASALAATGRVHHFHPPADGSQSATNGSAADSYQRNLIEEQFNFLIYECGDRSSAWTRHAIRQADQVIFVAARDAHYSIVDREEQLSSEPGFDIKRKHLVLLHEATASAPCDLTQWIGLHDFERVYPVRSGHREDLARLSRFIAGTAIGVVLGGGGARGFAHLGILRAIEESGIPIDLLGGNSMGALIGAQYAMGVPLDEIRKRTQALAAGGERLTLPLISLVSGRRVERDVRQMFGETDIRNLWRPFFTVACNLTKGCTTTLDSGPLWRAVMASNSPAGLFPPVLDRGDLLVDGAILDNVPVEAMRMRLGTPLEKRKGNGTIIAIDVDARAGPSADPDLVRLSAWSTLKGLFTARQPRYPDIRDILYSAGHIGGANQRSRTIAQADHYLEPPVSQFSLTDYPRAEEIGEIGYRFAVEAIVGWNRNPES